MSEESHTWSENGKTVDLFIMFIMELDIYKNV